MAAVVLISCHVWIW